MYMKSTDLVAWPLCNIYHLKNELKSKNIKLSNIKRAGCRLHINCTLSILQVKYLNKNSKLHLTHRGFGCVNLNLILW